jgi:hypothetical protein
MATLDISGLRKRSNAFVRELDVWSAIAIADNEKLIVDLNRKQMLGSRLSSGKPIKPPYSKPYAKKKGFNKPNLKVKGNFQNEMFLVTNENKKTYAIGSENFVTPFLENLYGGDIFGVEKKNIPDAEKASSDRLFNLYELNVLRK